MKKNFASKTEKGQSLVELAVSMTFLLILVSGVIDFGRLFFTYTALRDAVQEGASYLAMEPVRCEETVERVRSHTTQPIDLSDMSVVTVEVQMEGTACTSNIPEANAEDICPGDDITVRVVYDSFEFAMPFFAGTSIPLEVVVHDSVLVDPFPQLGPDCPVN